MTDFNLYHCLSPEDQRGLKKLFPRMKPPADPWNKKVDTEIESVEEISRIMKQKPQNVKRGDKW